MIGTAVDGCRGEKLFVPLAACSRNVTCLLPWLVCGLTNQAPCYFSITRPIPPRTTRLRFIVYIYPVSPSIHAGPGLAGQHTMKLYYHHRILNRKSQMGKVQPLASQPDTQLATCHLQAAWAKIWPLVACACNRLGLTYLDRSAVHACLHQIGVMQQLRRRRLKCGYWGDVTNLYLGSLADGAVGFRETALRCLMSGTAVWLDLQQAYGLQRRVAGCEGLDQRSLSGHLPRPTISILKAQKHLG